MRSDAALGVVDCCIMITLPVASPRAANRAVPAVKLRNPLPPSLEGRLPGSWRYRQSDRRRRVPLLAILLAAGAHALGLLGFNERGEERAAVALEEEAPVLMVMPRLDELEEPDPALGDGEPVEEIEASSFVPMLADVPSVELNSAFVQKMDFSSLQPRPDLDSAKIVTIPTGMRHGGGSGPIGANMKDLFNLSDLDRIPDPVFQPAPIFPAALKREVTSARVEVEFIVTAQGKVVEARVIDSTHSGFDNAAVVGVSRWQFRPGMKGGRPVNTRMRVPLIFRVMEE